MSKSDDTFDSSTFQPLRFVAVHLGVGHVQDEKKYLEFAKKICEEVMKSQNEIKQTCTKCNVPTRGETTAETAVIQLVKKMEDNPDLNCGLGSNLNMDGQVECDAAFMSNNTGKWTGVGAVSGCKNPILLIQSLRDHQDVRRPDGLAQPNSLVGLGAQQWVQDHCPELSVPDGDLISSRALRQYQQYKSSYDGSVKQEADGGPRKKQRQEDEGVKYSAVGAIAVDHEYNFVAAVSSGGALFKHKGSIGQAAVPGGGCWADDKIAIITTRVGEYLSQSLTVKSIAETIHEFRRQYEETYDEIFEKDIDDLEVSFNECIHIPDSEGGKDPVGVLAVNTFWGDCIFYTDENSKLYFHYGSNTENMCVGYMSREDLTAHSIMSKKKDERVVRTIVIPYGPNHSPDHDFHEG